MLPLLPIALAAAAHPELSTVAEQSGFVRTGRYEEVVALCPTFERAFPENVRCLRFGTTPEGRPMLALAASADGVLDPAAARARKRPVILLQGGIHAGEIDGKDAGFLLLRQLLTGEAGKGVLNGVTLLFVPVFNVDGHERFGANHRPNQIGPEEMGFRVTAQRFNLNRDYVKADSPEMEAMLRLLDAWDPILYADLHVTDGAEFQPGIAVLLEPAQIGAPELRELGKKAEDFIQQKLAAFGPLPFYPSFVDDEDPASGFAHGIGPPRFSHAYWAARNRFGVLVETHSWKNYAERVRSTREACLAMLELGASEGPAWLEAAAAADQADRKGGRKVALSYKPKGKPVTLAFPGYHYDRIPSAVSGKTYVRYDTSRPEVWNVPFWPEMEPAAEVTPPAGGWIVPAAWADVVGHKLMLHGFSYVSLPAQRDLAVRTFRAEEVKFAPAPFEGHHPVTLRGSWKPERRDVPGGSLFVPANQPGRALLTHLLEPTGPDSLVAWGFFDGSFERKEYIETYVLEPAAEAMLKNDPALRAEFQKRLADPAFAGDPKARLDFFAQRHPSWDEVVNLYPVYEVDRKP